MRRYPFQSHPAFLWSASSFLDHTRQHTSTIIHDFDAQQTHCFHSSFTKFLNNLIAIFDDLFWFNLHDSTSVTGGNKTKFLPVSAPLNVSLV